MSSPSTVASLSTPQVASKLDLNASAGDDRPLIVSIVIPTYNRAQLLAEAIASVAAQTYPHWEAIVVDDASTDDTRSLLEQLASRDRRVKPIFSPSNLGVSQTRNLGLKHASGNLINFLDSDDAFAPQKLEKQVRHFQQAPDLDVSICQTACFQSSPEDATQLFAPLDTDTETFLPRLLAKTAKWQTGAPLWQRSFLVDKVGFFPADLFYCEDWEYHVRAMCQRPQISVTLEPLNYYRLHGDAVSLLNGQNLDRTRRKRTRLQARCNLQSRLLAWESLRRAGLDNRDNRAALSQDFLKQGTGLLRAGYWQDVARALSYAWQAAPEDTNLLAFSFQGLQYLCSRSKRSRPRRHGLGSPKGTHDRHDEAIET